MIEIRASRSDRMNVALGLNPGLMMASSSQRRVATPEDSLAMPVRRHDVTLFCIARPPWVETQGYVRVVATRLMGGFTPTMRAPAKTPAGGDEHRPYS
jgi:hypothetical protein